MLNDNILRYQHKHHIGTSKEMLYHPFIAVRRQVAEEVPMRRELETVLLERERKRRLEEERHRRLELEAAILEREICQRRRLEEELQRRRAIEAALFERKRLHQDMPQREALPIRIVFDKETKGRKPSQYRLIKERSRFHPVVLEDSHHMSDNTEFEIEKDPKHNSIRANDERLYQVSVKPRIDGTHSHNLNNVRNNVYYGNGYGNKRPFVKRVCKKEKTSETEVLIGGVEDASDDEMENSSSVWTNRIPSKGQWIEPVAGFDL